MIVSRGMTINLQRDGVSYVVRVFKDQRMALERKQGYSISMARHVEEIIGP